CWDYLARITRSRCVTHQAEPNITGVPPGGIEPPTHGLGNDCPVGRFGAPHCLRACGTGHFEDETPPALVPATTLSAGRRAAPAFAGQLLDAPCDPQQIIRGKVTKDFDLKFPKPKRDTSSVFLLRDAYCIQLRTPISRVVLRQNQC